MIVDTFLEWAQQAPPMRRIEAADALARAFLHSELDAQERNKVLVGLFALVDDPLVEVRQRLADTFADRRDAPRAVVLRLLDDVPAVSARLYARSPLLLASHLRDAIHRGEPKLCEAVAQREDLAESTVTLLLDEADAEACKALVSNPFVRLDEPKLERFITRFGGDTDALETLQATRSLPPELQCMVVAQCAQAYAVNPLVQAFVPGKRLNRLANGARERALLQVMADLDAGSCARAAAALHPMGVITPAFLLRVALSGEVTALEALVAQLCQVPMNRVRSAFVHARPAVAAALLKKTGLSEDVRVVLSMALVLARELAAAEVPWTAGFFAETLIEVVDQKQAAASLEGEAESLTPDEETVALCHSIAADIMQAEARAQSAQYLPQPDDAFDGMLALPSPDADDPDDAFSDMIHLDAIERLVA